MWGYEKEQRQRTHETERRAMKSPRMVHEPWHRVTRNKRHTNLILTAVIIPPQISWESRLRFRCAMWNINCLREQTKMDYIPEHFRTAIDSGCIGMSVFMIFMLKVNIPWWWTMLQALVSEWSYDHVGRPRPPSRHWTSCLRGWTTMGEDKRLRR